MAISNVRLQNKCFPTAIAVNLASPILKPCESTMPTQLNIHIACLAQEASLLMQHADNTGRMLLYIAIPTVQNARGSLWIRKAYFRYELVNTNVRFHPKETKSTQRFISLKLNPLPASAAKRIMHDLQHILRCYYIWKTAIVALAGKSVISTTLLIHVPEQKTIWSAVSLTGSWLGLLDLLRRSRITTQYVSIGIVLFALRRIQRRVFWLATLPDGLAHRAIPGFSHVLDALKLLPNWAQCSTYWNATMQGELQRRSHSGSTGAPQANSTYVLSRIVGWTWPVWAQTQWSRWRAHSHDHSWRGSIKWNWLPFWRRWVCLRPRGLYMCWLLVASCEDLSKSS